MFEIELARLQAQLLQLREQVFDDLQARALGGACGFRLGSLGSGGQAAGDTYVSVENVTGSTIGDILIGNAAVYLVFTRLWPVSVADRIEAAWPALKEHYGERFYRMWRYYLQCCAGTFRARDNQLWQVVLSPSGHAGGYRRPLM